MPTVPGDAPAVSFDPATNAAETAFFTPTMFGDFGPTLRFGSAALTPYISKIADDSSPRPLDRVYVNFNYYNNLGQVPPAGPAISGYVETIGFEKTFWDGNASIGMRLPFLQLVGTGFNNSSVGDLSLSAKYAFINERDTVLSAGLSITVPTGPCATLPSGNTINPVFFQPFVGLLLNSDGAFLHGFSSIMIPTDSRDVTLWFNDIGVGYWLYRDCTNTRIISAITPTFEVHVNTPLNNRYPGAANNPNVVPFADDVNLTMGATFFLGDTATLGGAYCLPVTGPRPFCGEVILQFNLRF